MLERCGAAELIPNGNVKCCTTTFFAALDNSKAGSSAAMRKASAYGA